MKIGEAIVSIEFTEAERTRLGAALQDPHGFPRTVLSTKAEGIRDHSFWISAQKRFDVTGFRPGNATAKKIVVRRALEDAKRPGGGHKIWVLYRRCVTEFVNEDLPELQELLSLEEFASSDGPLTEQIMRSIAPRMPVYGVTADQVLKVYELWGFDRSDQVESILSGSGVDINVVKELLTRSERGLSQRIEQRIAREAREATVALEAQLAKGLTEWRMELDQLKQHVASVVDATKKEVLKESVSVKGRQEEPRDRVRTPPRVDSSLVQRLSTQLDELRSTVNRHDRLLAEVGRSNRPTLRPATKKDSNETGNKYSRVANAFVPMKALVAFLLRR